MNFSKALQCAFETRISDVTIEFMLFSNNGREKQLLEIISSARAGHVPSPLHFGGRDGLSFHWGEGGSEIFILVGELYCWGGGNFVRGTHNFEVKIKTA